MWFMVYGLKFMVQCKHLCKPSWVSPQFERSRREREGREGRAEAMASAPHMHVTAPTPPPLPPYAHVRDGVAPHVQLQQRHASRVHIESRVT